MKSLTKQDMLDIMYARACMDDPNEPTPEASAKYDAFVEVGGKYDPALHATKEEYIALLRQCEGENLKQLRRGQELLKQWSVRRLSGTRSTALTFADGTYLGQDQAEYTLRVLAGWIGTMQAYVTYAFVPRQ